MRRAGNRNSKGKRPRGNGQILFVREFLEPAIKVETIGVDPHRDGRVGIRAAQRTQEVGTILEGIVPGFRREVRFRHEPPIAHADRHRGAATQFIDNRQSVSFQDVVHAESGERTHLSALDPVAH